jgi:hypothetical protein
MPRAIFDFQYRILSQSNSGNALPFAIREQDATLGADLSVNVWGKMETDIAELETSTYDIVLNGQVAVFKTPRPAVLWMAILMVITVMLSGQP